MYILVIRILFMRNTQPMHTCVEIKNHLMRIEKHHLNLNLFIITNSRGIQLIQIKA